MNFKGADNSGRQKTYLKTKKSKKNNNIKAINEKRMLIESYKSKKKEGKNEGSKSINRRRS